MTETTKATPSSQQPMAAEFRDHLFHILPFYDVVDNDEVVVVDLHNRPDITNIQGALQGGMVATLIDVAGGRLAAKAAPEGHGVSTANLNIHYLAPIHIGPARATATPVRVGRRTIVVAVDVADVGGGRQAARATLSFAVMAPRGADQAVTGP